MSWLRVVFAGAVSAAFGACSLNPQPLPPATYDAAIESDAQNTAGDVDGATDASTDAATFADVAAPSPEGGDTDANASADASDANGGDAADGSTEPD